MELINGFINLFRSDCPERQRKEHLRRARLELEEAEIGVEDYTARRDKLKARITRLESASEDGRPARSSIQAPHPGPSRSKVGAFSIPDAPAVRSRPGAMA